MKVGLTRLLRELHRRGHTRPLDLEAAVQAFIGPLVFLRFTHLGLTATPDLSALEAAGERHVAFFWDSIRKQNVRSGKE